MGRSHIEKRDTILRQLLDIQSRLIHRYLNQFRIITLEEECGPMIAGILRGNRCAILYK